KDLRAFVGDKAKETQCDVGEGIMPFPAIFKTLKSMNYQGGVMLEYEINADHPQAGITKAFTYFRGVLAGMKA
ncbi:MAG: sugar phosphate isomerase/epimerase, partial [Bryobacteraceae bacterium]